MILNYSENGWSRYKFITMPIARAASPWLVFFFVLFEIDPTGFNFQAVPSQPINHAGMHCKSSEAHGLQVQAMLNRYYIHMTTHTQVCHGLAMDHSFAEFTLVIHVPTGYDEKVKIVKINSSDIIKDFKGFLKIRKKEKIER